MIEVGKYKKILHLIDNKKSIFRFILLFLLASFLDVVGISSVIPLLAGAGNLEFLGIFNFEIIRNSYLSTIIALLFLLKAILLFYINYRTLCYAEEQQISIRKKLTSKYMYMNYDEYIKRNSSEYISAIQVLADRFANHIIIPILRLVSDFIISSALIVFLLYLYPDIVIVIVGAFLFIILLYNFFFAPKVSNYGRKAYYHYQLMIKNLMEGIKGYKEILILGKQQFFINTIEHNSSLSSENHIKAQAINSSPKYILEFIIVLLLVYIINKDDTGGLSVTLSIFGLASIRMLPMLSQISNSILNIKYADDVVFKLYQELSTVDNKIYNTILPAQKKIEFNELNIKNLYFKYGDKVIFRNFNLNVFKGEIIGIIGKSGSGKSTLIDIIMGFHPDTYSNIFLNKFNISTNISAWQNIISYMPQSIFILDASILQNIVLSNDKVDNNKLNNVINTCQLGGYISSLNDGYNTVVGENGVSISGGQKQRLSLARALYANRQLLIIDEGTSALDSDTEDEVIRELNILKGDKTIFLITHNKKILHICDKVINLDSGCDE